ncbi:MAG: OmpA family protein [Rhodospirillaceae bacterium]|nr:OmpA family protein [Rhodospirillaceae bacterium]
MNRPSVSLCALAVAAAIGLSACAPKANLVVVLPESNGHVGAVVVKDTHGATKGVLDRPYAAVGASAGSTDVQRVTVDTAEVQKIFGPALAAQPLPPASFVLYFETNTDVLTPPSRAAFEGVFQDIARRTVAEVVVTGHTDTMGDLAYNDELSLRRARKVRDMLIARGIPPQNVAVAGRGERELVVQTPDETPEPRNRRVVVTVR